VACRPAGGGPVDEPERLLPLVDRIALGAQQDDAVPVPVSRDRARERVLRGVRVTGLGGERALDRRQEQFVLIPEADGAGVLLPRQDRVGQRVVADEPRLGQRRAQEDRHVVRAGELLPAVQAGRRLHVGVVRAEP